MTTSLCTSQLAPNWITANPDNAYSIGVSSYTGKGMRSYRAMHAALSGRWYESLLNTVIEQVAYSDSRLLSSSPAYGFYNKYREPSLALTLVSPDVTSAIDLCKTLRDRLRQESVLLIHEKGERADHTLYRITGSALTEISLIERALQFGYEGGRVLAFSNTLEIVGESHESYTAIALAHIVGGTLTQIPVYSTFI